MKKIRLICYLGLVVILAGLAGAPARADETVNVGGSRVILIKPKAPRGSVILMPGGNGAIRADDQGGIHGLNYNQLVRTRHAYAARGLAPDDHGCLDRSCQRRNTWPRSNGR